MRFCIVIFPGSNCDHDCQHLTQHILGQPTTLLWHKETALPDVDVVIIPGGFSYGDYLRAGAIARFSPIMRAVIDFADRGGLVLGICNGFQILVESALLPGAFLRNRSLKFICKDVFVRVENNQTPFTSLYQNKEVLSLPIAHAEGNYYAEPALLARLTKNNQILFRYCLEGGALTEAGNPNGSSDYIAGVCNERGNVLGMMPHPERASDTVLGNDDGLRLFQSLLGAKAGSLK